MSKQTAVEWLVKEYHLLPDNPLVQQAKEMEKKYMIQLVQRLKDYTNESHNILGHDDREASEFVDIFYNETYGGDK